MNKYNRSLTIKTWQCIWSRSATLVEEAVNAIGYAVAQSYPIFQEKPDWVQLAHRLVNLEDANNVDALQKMALVVLSRGMSSPSDQITDGPMQWNFGISGNREIHIHGLNTDASSVDEQTSSITFFAKTLNIDVKSPINDPATVAKKQFGTNTGIFGIRIFETNRKRRTLLTQVLADAVARYGVQKAIGDTAPTAEIDGKYCGNMGSALSLMLQEDAMLTRSHL